MDELYLYYKVRTDDVGAALAAFEALNLGVAAPRMLCRQDEAQGSPGMQTWMEIYNSGSSDQSAAEAQVAAALRPFIQGARHLERFKPLLK
ncbi:DUF4936 family protein [Paucibacter sp. KCTC 42545]|uniref:DUF4936 family protein n=1 Tax=Paucibacter sp. KCTC 42545 TaxID=1768242 RepID=UPI000733C2F7|nr:DUF4936 family protein [Paucibacter sp. KCTC 42545]ALT77206.1 hypothetical protein AT984_08400 [Paucibacter sp. KCTC 42545]